MNRDIENFLQFKGKSIFFIDQHGQYWIAIKPICQTQNVDYLRQFRNIKKDPILKENVWLQSSIAADNRRRLMVCLPEFFIYTWILAIRSSFPDLLEFIRECNRLIYEHFKGNIIPGI